MLINRRGFLGLLTGAVVAEIAKPITYVLPPPNDWRPNFGKWKLYTRTGRLYCSEDTNWLNIGEVTDVSFMMNPLGIADYHKELKAMGFKLPKRLGASNDSSSNSRMHAKA